jgi:hypothetical protein
MFPGNLLKTPEFVASARSNPCHSASAAAGLPWETAHFLVVRPLSATKFCLLSANGVANAT